MLDKRKIWRRRWSVLSRTYATFDPTHKSDDLVLSNGNLTASVGAFVDDSVRSTLGKTTGKWYWETAIDVVGGSFCMVGIEDSTFGTNAIAINGGLSWAYTESGSKVSAGAVVAYGNTFTTGAVIGVALDMDNGKVFFSKNGVWQNSGDPVAGTGAAYTGLTGTIYPAVGGFNVRPVFTANFGATPLIYSAPSGFTSGVYA